jgi:O-methyltransferase
MGHPSWPKRGESLSRRVLRAHLSAKLKSRKATIRWIPGRFHDEAERRFCFVHVDVDLQPTLDSVTFFYPRLESCGILVCDDYGFMTCPGAMKAIHEFFVDKPEHVIHLPTAQALVIKH